MAKRAAIYCRISRAYREEGEDRLSIETQLADAETYCEEKGYVIVARYIDQSKYKVRGKLQSPSGERKDRPGYVAMLKAARAGEIDVIISWKEDRLFRGAFAATPLAEILEQRRGVLTVELCKENFDPQMLMLKASIAKIELDAIRQRTIRARQARLERGEIPGGNVRYGYRKVNKKLEIDEEQARVVRMVFDLYLETGGNNLEIRRRLNGSGIPAPTGKVWSKSTIIKLLQFKGYAYGKHEVILDGKRYEIETPPIISVETFEAAQATRAGNRTYPARNVIETYLARGLVVCACGLRMGAKMGGGTKRYPKKYGFYRCNLHDARPEQQSPKCPHSIAANIVDKKVWESVVEVIRNPQIVQRAIDAKIAVLRAENEAILNEGERTQRQLDELAQERQMTIALARKKIITESDLAFQLSALDIEAADLRKKLADKEAATAAISQAERLKEWAEGYLKNVETGIDVLECGPEELSESQRAELYKELDAARFESKYDGDRGRALEWAMFEERRRIVRFLVSKINVFLDDEGKKQVVPILFMDLPYESMGGLEHGD